MVHIFLCQKPKEESRGNEAQEEEIERAIKESGEIEDKQTPTDRPETTDGLSATGVELSRSELSSTTASDKNNQSTAIPEITTAMETLATNTCDSALHDSREKDEGFDEAGDIENELNSDDEEDEIDDDDNENDDDDENDDDGEGWITPDNISRVKDEMGKASLDAVPASVTVGCLTTDFAMQVIICPSLVCKSKTMNTWI